MVAVSVISFIVGGFVGMIIMALLAAHNEEDSNQ